MRANFSRGPKRLDFGHFSESGQNRKLIVKNVTLLLALYSISLAANASDEVKKYFPSSSSLK